MRIKCIEYKPIVVMQPIQPSDTVQLESAKGWCELGSFNEANEELEKITSPYSFHPDVLEVRWQIDSHLKRRDTALEIAVQIIKLDPERVTGWLYKASSLQELNRPKEAYETLIEANERFPANRSVLFELSDICCMLPERLNESDDWLAKSLELGINKVKTQEFDDPRFDQFNRQD